MSRGILTAGDIASEQIRSHRRFSALEVSSVEKALRHVCDVMVKIANKRGQKLESMSENELSELIVFTFDDLIARNAGTLDPLSRHFDPLPEPEAHRSSFNYAGERLNKRPDFAFRRQTTPVGESRLHGCFFVEAKLIRQDKKMDLYCGEGLIRFVRGDYSWGTVQGMMLGYRVLSNQKLPEALAAHLARRGKKEMYLLESGPIPFPQSRYRDRMYQTTHGRNWKYPNSNESPGPIDVYHLWLDIHAA